MLRISLTFLAIFIITSCNARELSTDSKPEISSSWIKINAGNVFSFMAPPDTVLIPGQGNDSFTGIIKSPKFKVTFDYGLYSNSLEKASEKLSDSYTTRKLLIDNREAILVTYISNEHPERESYFIGIHFPKIKRSTIGSIKLSMQCFLKNSQNKTTIEKIYKSIVFNQSQ